MVVVQEAFGVNGHIEDVSERFGQMRHPSPTGTSALHQVDVPRSARRCGGPALRPGRDVCESRSSVLEGDASSLDRAHQTPISAEEEILHEPRVGTVGRSARYQDEEANVMEVTQPR